MTRTHTKVDAIVNTAVSSPTASESTRQNTMAASECGSNDDTIASTTIRHDWIFYSILFALAILGFAGALDNTIVFTALPTIIESSSLEGTGVSQYVWIVNAYSLSSTVIQPLIGQACDVFGRKKPALFVVAVFALGGGLAGGANGIVMLIVARTIQGLGAGGIFVLIELVVCDLLPQQERGKYIGIILGASAVGSTIGPLVGGALAQKDWRWVFYLVLPFATMGLIWMSIFLKLNYRRTSSLGQALLKVDWFGNILFIGSMTAILLALLMGGVTFSWSSANIIIPLVLGTIGWAAFHLYESRITNPAVPQRLFANRNAALGYFLTFEAGMFLATPAYILPLYFQAVKGTSPLVSGVDTLPLNTFMMPAAIVAGGVMAKTGLCRPLHFGAWALFALSFGLLTTLDTSSSKAEWVIFQVLLACGLGLSFVTILPAIQSTLPETDAAASTGAFSFVRSFGIVWGTVIPSTIFNLQIDANLHMVSDQSLRDVLAHGGAYAFAAGGTRISTLPPLARTQVTALYTAAIQPIWYTMLTFSLLGILAVLLQKRITLRQDLDTEFGIDRKESKDTASLESMQSRRGFEYKTEQASSPYGNELCRLPHCEIILPEWEVATILLLRSEAVHKPIL